MAKIKKHIPAIIITLIFVSGITTISVFAATYSTDTIDIDVTVNGWSGASDDCLNTMSLENPNQVSGKLKAADTHRYGDDVCNIEINHTDPNELFVVAIGLNSPGTMGDGTNLFADIDDYNGDCIMDTSGNTEEEEFGFRIENLSAVSGVTVQTATRPAPCNVSYSATATSPDNYFFSFKYWENADQVIKSAGSVPRPVCFSGDCSFDFKVAANVEWDTYADTTYDTFSVGGDYTVNIIIGAPSP